MSGGPPFEVAYDAGLVATGIRIPKWSMRFLQVDRPTHLARPASGAVRVVGDSLVGTAANPLPFPLRNCHVICRWNHVSVGDIGPGESRRFTLRLRLPYRPLPHGAQPDAYTDGQAIFSKDTWRPNPFSDVQRELLSTVVEGWGTMFESPLLVGWGEATVEQPLLMRPRCSIKEMHFYAIRLSVAMEGEDLSVPVCLSRFHRARSELREEERESSQRWERAEWMSAYEFNMPFRAERVRSDELKIHAHVSTWLPDAPAPRASVWLADWEGRRWVQVADRAAGGLDISVPAPSRFVKLPEGLVRVKIGPRSGYFWGRIDWLDISYKGKRLSPSAMQR